MCAEKLNRNPNLRDLRLIGGVSEPVLYKHFGGLAKGLTAAGLEVIGPGFNQPEATLLLDWAAVARKLGKIPSVHEYGSAGRFSISPFQSRYRRWGAVPEGFRVDSRIKERIRMAGRAETRCRQGSQGTESRQGVYSAESP